MTVYLEPFGKPEPFTKPEKSIYDLFNTLPTVKHSLKTVSKIPNVNSLETDVAFKFIFAVPGFKKEDLKVGVVRENGKNILSVSAETKTIESEIKSNFIFSEFDYSTFKRVFTLPDNAKISEIAAEYVNGILTVDIPKIETDLQDLVIEVK